MNTPSPEDRLLDELLREQSAGPDHEFLRRIEAAVDAGPVSANKVHSRVRYGRLAIAAGIGLAAGVTFILNLEKQEVQKVITARTESAARKEKAEMDARQLSIAIRDQEDKVEERRKVLATIAATTASGENLSVVPPLLGNLIYVKDESLAWVLLPSYGAEGHFQFKYEDTKGGTNKLSAAEMAAPNGLLFPKAPMMNRFKLLGSEVRRVHDPRANIDTDVTIVRIEDQRENKKGTIYEIPAPLSDQRKNEFLQYDRTAVFSLAAAGMESTEFKVEENTAFSLPPGGEKKEFLLKSINPASVVVELIGSGKTVTISKGAKPAGQDIATLAQNSNESLQVDNRDRSIARGLDAQDYVDAKKDLATDAQLLRKLKGEPELPASEVAIFDPGLPLLPPLASPSGEGSGGSGKGSGSGTGLGARVEKGVGNDFAPASFSRSRDAAMASLQAPIEQTSGDRYGSFIEQPWKSPDSDPLSTFSIDVDTASYGNVRRMIREGRQIPKDAVRIEEFINAFSYHYAQPKGEGPFAVGASIADCPWAPGHQLVRVAIKGREIDANKRPASNLVFLIDVSGSMQSPDKLPLLKQSMAMLVEQLDERDRVAIVVYAGNEGVALPSTRIDEEGRAAVLKALARLDAGGSTNGGAGIKLAYDLAMKQKIEGGVNRVILATDGDFNVGVTGQESLVELVKDRAKGGVFLTVAGFGTGNLNDAMMDAITHDGNGNYFYIDSEREGRKVFLKNLTGTLVTIAKDVKIQVEFNPAKVGSYRLIGYANRVLKNEDFNNDKVDAGDIGAGHTVTAFYELTPPGGAVGNDLKYQAAPAKPAASNEWLTVKLRHKHPEGDESSKIEFPLTGDVSSIEKADTDFQFATAAALMGMKLRGMEEVREMPWEKVLELAKPGLADDASEDRAEFVELVKKLGGSHERIVPAPAEVAPENRK